MHRFFIEPGDVLNENLFELSSREVVHQFVNVLRFKEGEKIILLNGDGYEYLCVIEKLSKKLVAGAVDKKTLPQYLNEKETKITLFFSMLKNAEKIELILQKCTELGVNSFVPIITERTERKFMPKIERVYRILKEATEQSGGVNVPEISEPIKFTKVLKNLPEGRNLILDFSAEKSLSDVKTSNAFNVFVGPEGGFSKAEIEEARGAGFELFLLGKRVLRAETACIATCSFLNLIK